MSTHTELPFRRRLVLGLNIFVVAILGLLFFGNSISTDIGDSALIILIALPFLALFQWCCAIYNIFKGSKAQLYYLLASVAYLVLYGGVASEWINVSFIRSEDIWFFLGVGSPLIFAAIFCFVLYFDHPGHYRSQHDTDGLLDADLR